MEYTKLLYEAYRYPIEESTDEQIQRLLRKLKARQINDGEMARLVRLTLRANKRVTIRYGPRAFWGSVYIHQVADKLPPGHDFVPLPGHPPEDIEGKFVYRLSGLSRTSGGVWWTLNELYAELKTRITTLSVENV